MVIYESMEIDLDTLDFKAPELEIDHNEVDIVGKRGKVLMEFNLLESGVEVGRGRKRMVLGGLREYEEAAMARAVAEFNKRREVFFS